MRTGGPAVRLATRPGGVSTASGSLTKDVQGLE
jgi:hypothetical protein